MYEIQCIHVYLLGVSVAAVCLFDNDENLWPIFVALYYFNIERCVSSVVKHVIWLIGMIVIPVEKIMKTRKKNKNRNQCKVRDYMHCTYRTAR